ncbi:cytochrome b/b6 domain-containing protein [Magnetospira sp. QH-2]|uniref:cytochrome b/b6 domain-containing protein n=1 Tax=Magnetospira sp. (strain QH-2) TaxID=1288970 RepID=UPI0003E8129D|nr:cytochrome b/b6 domain-containing protein [Magnetospira sp. QH-2]CCQ74302.1 Putative cytochrome B561 [Magnetospira sp. QH-2]
MAKDRLSAAPGIRVWDLPTRLFHWGLVGLVAFSVYTGKSDDVTLMANHMLIGQIVLALILFRILWGFLGSRRSRFTDFVPGPRTLITFLKTKQSPTPGHNPLGAFSVLAMLAALLVQAVTGLFANDDIFNEGPLVAKVSKDLSDTLTGYHHLSSTVVLVLIGLHLLAIIGYRLKGENLVKAMITGRRKPRDGWRDRPYAPWWLALILLGLSAGGVWALVTL